LPRQTSRNIRADPMQVDQPRERVVLDARQCPVSIVFPTQQDRCEPPSGCISHPRMRFSPGSLWRLRSYRDGDGPPAGRGAIFRQDSSRASGDLATLEPARVEPVHGWSTSAGFGQPVRCNSGTTYQPLSICALWWTSSPQVGVDVDAAPRRLLQSAVGAVGLRA